MLKKQMEQFITNSMSESKLPLFDFEEEYAKKHNLLSSDETIVEKTFFTDVLERCNKETEELEAVETPAFLKKSITYLKEQPNEFVYVESTLFELIRVDAVALELDNIFKTYSALFGLKLQKKFGDAIKTYLKANLREDAKFSVMFSGEDGLWEMNIALDDMEGFNEAQSFEESFKMIYRFAFKLLEAIEESQ